MEWYFVLLIFFAMLLVFFATGMPVAFAFALLNIVGLAWWVDGTKGWLLLPASAYRSVASFSLIAVPMFFLMGEVLFQSRVIEVTIDVLDRWIGRMRARLLFVALGAGTALATLSGAGMADTALIGATLHPEMERRGYDRKLSLGTIMSAGLLAAIIPPSALAVLLGSLAEVSIAALLVGGLLPGLLMSIIYGIYIYTRVRLDPSLAPHYSTGDVTWGSRFRGLLQISPLAVIVVMVMGFIIFGVTTPSEAAATGAIGAFIVAIIYRKLSFSVTRRALMGTLYIAGMVFLIITGATALGQLLSLTGATREFLRVLTEIPVPDIVLLIIIQLAVMMLGFFIDQLSIMLVAIPILLPIVKGLGFDPVWFWIIFLMNISVAAITPPFGLVLFALKGVVPRATMADLYKASLPFIVLDIIAIALVIAFPSIATWLPSKIA